MSRLLNCAGLAFGWAISAWVIPGHWILILLLGAVLCVGQLQLARRFDRGETDGRQPGARSDFDAMRPNILVGTFALCTLVMLWALFGTGGMVPTLYPRHPVLASGSVSLAGFLIGLTAWAAINRRKLISR